MLQAKQKDISDELKAIAAYERHYSPKKNREKKLLNDYRYKELINGSLNNNDYITRWVNEPYIPNSYKPEALTIEAMNGLLVRSKSEQLIDLVLTEYGIPHRYECQLNLDGHIIYPDFTLLHPDTLELIYLEHFGMMNNPAYVQRNYISKMQTYTNNGIIPDVNLICTFETKDNPLSYEYVKKKIGMFFD